MTEQTTKIKTTKSKTNTKAKITKMVQKPKTETKTQQQKCNNANSGSRDEKLLCQWQYFWVSEATTHDMMRNMIRMVYKIKMMITMMMI
jgi:hypothetical protein